MSMVVNNYEIPSWAGKPPTGLHLDVMKDGKMIQKLMIDEKKAYFFGRNKQMCDFSIDHQSCSRVHAVLVWHKHLIRPFIIDLKSTHGTYVGCIRIDGQKPQAVPLDSELHFGASSRMYVIRERPQPKQITQNEETDKNTDDKDSSFLHLPETESELDNLTEFNTAHNRRIAAIQDLGNIQNTAGTKRKLHHVHFNEDDEVINPEDIDPSVGRFRNLVSTTIIPKKKSKIEPSMSMTESLNKRMQHLPYQSHHTTHLYHDLDHDTSNSLLHGSYSAVTKLGIRLPNLAPDIDHLAAEPDVPTVAHPAPNFVAESDVLAFEPKKKKYAKEAWPGKKPAPSLLVA